MFPQQKSIFLRFSITATLLFLAACGDEIVTIANLSESPQLAANEVTSSPSPTEQSSTKQQVKSLERSKLTINSLGAVKVGMSIEQAEKAAGITLTRRTNLDNAECFYVRPQGSNYDLLFMVTDNQISRIDVRADSRLTTVSGAKIGDTEAKIKSLYPGQIEVTQHHYVSNGHYLTFTPKNPNEQNYRLIFETDGNRVTMFRSGKLPEVEFIEGCS